MRAYIGSKREYLGVQSSPIARTRIGKVRALSPRQLATLPMAAEHKRTLIARQRSLTKWPGGSTDAPHLIFHLLPNIFRIK